MEFELKGIIILLNLIQVFNLSIQTDIILRSFFNRARARAIVIYYLTEMLSYIPKELFFSVVRI